MSARAEFEHAHAERRRQIVADLLVMRPNEVAAKYRISRQRVHQIKQKEARRNGQAHGGAAPPDGGEGP